MKKSLIALAALAATASYAQSSVEIYGIIDQAYTTTTSKYSDSDAFVSKATAVTSGTQSGLATQRIGFRGTEDLGGGMKGLFQIESSLSAGSAGDNGFGSRPTFVGVSGGFGTVLLGRQDTPLLKAVVPQLAGGANNMIGQIMWSPFTGAALVGGAASAQMSSADAGYGRIARETTVDRAIDYITPTFGGFNAELQYGVSDAKLAGDVANTLAKTTDQGLNVKYANGPLTLNAAVHTQKLDSSTNANDYKNTNNYIGATYNFGVANVSLQHGTSKRELGGAEIYHNKGTQLGVQVPVSATVALFGSVGTGTREVKDFWGSINGPVEFKQKSFQLGATYAFSKRTKLYAAYGMQQLKSTNIDWDYGYLSSAKLKETQFGVGLNHSF